jgi:hypothetical protein
MDDATRLRLRDLLATQKALLSAVASGARAPNDAEADYRRVHSDLRQILTAENRNCVCPWGSVHQWAAYAGASAGWEDLLEGLIGPYEVLAADTDEAPWRLVDYLRNGDPDDIPFSEFEASLEPHKAVILDTALRRDLAIRGPSVIDDWTRGHKMVCDAKSRPKKTVFMYKIKHGHATGEVILRVFFMTAPGHCLVLLHGYDKGADLDPAQEGREAAEACLRRSDVIQRLADDRRS